MSVIRIRFCVHIHFHKVQSKFSSFLIWFQLVHDRERYYLTRPLGHNIISHRVILYQYTLYKGTKNRKCIGSECICVHCAALLNILNELWMPDFTAACILCHIVPHHHPTHRMLFSVHRTDILWHFHFTQMRWLSSAIYILCVASRCDSYTRRRHRRRRHCHRHTK